MLGALICSLIMTGNSSVFVNDSTIYQLDSLKSSLYSRQINNPIDYVSDDFLYVLTRRQLIKINIHDLRLVDRLPLPYQFNYMLITPLYIGLITSNEIVLIDRHNLGYVTSIGLETGDNKPLIKDYTDSHLSGNKIFICRNSETKSILLAIDTQTGEIKRKITTARIVTSYYSLNDKKFYFFDVNKQLQIYDQDIKKISKINVGIIANNINNDPSGLFVEGSEFLSLCDYNGKLFDFQPIPLSARANVNIMGLVHKNRIVLIDPLTIRPMNISIDAAWINVFEIGDPDFFIAQDTLYRFHLVSMPALETCFLPVKKPGIYISKPLPPTAQTSFWYIQTGAFFSRANAERHQQIHRQSGIPALIEESDMFRVKIGGFSDKETARYFIDYANLIGWLVHQPLIKNNENMVFSVNSENFWFNDGIITKEKP